MAEIFSILGHYGVSLLCKCFMVLSFGEWMRKSDAHILDDCSLDAYGELA
jgi:hypothetical protein